MQNEKKLINYNFSYQILIQQIYKEWEIGDINKNYLKLQNYYLILLEIMQN